MRCVNTKIYKRYVTQRNIDNILPTTQYKPVLTGLTTLDIKNMKIKSNILRCGQK